MLVDFSVGHICSIAVRICDCVQLASSVKVFEGTLMTSMSGWFDGIVVEPFVDDSAR